MGRWGCVCRHNIRSMRGRRREGEGEGERESFIITCNEPIDPLPFFFSSLLLSISKWRYSPLFRIQYNVGERLQAEDRSGRERTPKNALSQIPVLQRFSQTA
jgi:hypothetical protein